MSEELGCLFYQLKSELLSAVDRILSSTKVLDSLRRFGHLCSRYCLESSAVMMPSFKRDKEAIVTAGLPWQTATKHWVQNLVPATGADTGFSERGWG